ncbi:fasciclin domain-containing protein [Tellurirhabdus rosea]|uniref:fasciclin domain-containing protein n=1 Tax=Tellurirhabdus rosea TaxID=2674997 RepID=UPI00224D98B8|nr:fasciclin domain-containing protein [Tellurirhabdus rosea]
MKNLKSLRWAKGLSMMLLVAGAPLLTSCDNDDDDATPTPTYSNFSDVLSGNTDYSLMRAAVTRAGLTDSLNRSNVTIFLPNDAAFRAAGFADAAAVNNASVSDLQRILRYHVVGSRVLPSAFETTGSASPASLGGQNLYITRNSGGQVFVNNARVQQTGIEGFENGQVYVIDRVLMPATGNLLQVAQADTSLSFLVAAARRAGGTVFNSLSSTTTPVTVFAPTNAAFRAAGFRDTTAIGAANRDTLTRILTYHVVPGRVFAPTLTNNQSVTTAQSGAFNVTVGTNNAVSITGRGNNNQAANVTRPDIMATNGVVHVIDRVLRP